MLKSPTLKPASSEAQVASAQAHIVPAGSAGFGGFGGGGANGD